MSRLPFIQAFTLVTALSASALAEVPTVVVEEALASERTRELSPESELSVLKALAGDERAQIRSAAAESLQSSELERFAEFEPLLKELVSDSSPSVRASACASFGRCVVSMPPMDRAIVLGDWAVETEAPLREAVASALGNQVFVPSSEVMLEHLLDDPRASVRRRAVDSVKLRHGDNGWVLAYLLDGALDDQDRDVRRSARRAVARAFAVSA